MKLSIPMSSNTYKWKVVPLSRGQLLDVNPDDILQNGHFRKCNVYKGGGGYDHFPQLASKYFNEDNHNLQFIVQLFGCNLDCPYCYVTREGVWGNIVDYFSSQLVEIFNSTNCSVFHLMGGAPAIYLKYWPELISELSWKCKKNWLFHSDLMLSEFKYEKDLLRKIIISRALYAVNIKGVTEEEYMRNTRKKMNPLLIWSNLEKLEECQMPYYFTFTGINQNSLETFWKKFENIFGYAAFKRRIEDAYSINLINYDAIPYVDSIPWGKQKE